MRLLVLMAHPAQQHSKVNTALANVARETEGVTFVDLYAKYPRMDIDVEKEQSRLLEHDAILFQFPLMWYSTPPILKEWQDLVLEYGFAYGAGGDELAGKLWLTAVSAGAPESAYGRDGHNKFELREFLTPMEATANLCQMPYIAPYTIFSSLNAPDIESHAAGYRKWIEAIRDDKFDVDVARAQKLMTANSLPIGVAK